MPVQESNTIRKINTTGGGNTGINYLTNEDSITVEGTQYTIDNGFNFGEVSDAVRDRAKYKQSLNIGSTIPEVTLNSSIVLLEEYNEAKRYAYSSHNYIGSNSSDGTVNETLNLPKRLDGWKYYTGSGYATLPEGTNLGEALIAYFSDNNNLNVYANWADDVKAIRVVVYPETPIPGITPRCSVSITSNTHTNGLLTSNYSKMLHRKVSNVDDIQNWAFVNNEFGSCSTSSIYGNGCPMVDSAFDDKPVPCYYGFISNDNITITIGDFNATGNGTNYTSVYKPHLVSNTPKYYESSTLSAYTGSHSPTFVDFSNVSGGVYTISKTGLTTDLTVFIPVDANTYTITVKCEDAANNTPSQKGYVDVTSLLRQSNPTDSILSVQCVNSETVTISASSQTGYVFDHWVQTHNGTTTQIQTQTFTLPISSSVNGDTFVAYFTQGNYTLTYHKEIPI
jgi:hypothetical protein